MSDENNNEKPMPDLTIAKDLISRLDKINDLDLVSNLRDLLQDKLAIIKLNRSIEEIEERLYKGKRAAFAGQTMGFDEEQIVLTLEKAMRKAKRLEEIERRKNSKGKELSEEQIEKLKSMGVYMDSSDVEDEEETEEDF